MQPEQLTAQTGERQTFLKKLKELLARILRRKKEEKEKEDKDKLYKQMKEAEREENWTKVEEEKKRKRGKKQQGYEERISTQATQKELKQIREQISQDASKKAKEHIENIAKLKFDKSQEQGWEEYAKVKEYNRVAYLLASYMDSPTKHQALRELIDKNAGVAKVLEKLLQKEDAEKRQKNPIELIKLGRQLVQAVKRTPEAQAVLADLIGQLKSHIIDTIAGGEKYVVEQNKKGEKIPSFKEQVIGALAEYLSEENQRALEKLPRMIPSENPNAAQARAEEEQNRKQWGEYITKYFNDEGVQRKAPEVENEEKSTGSLSVPGEFVAKVDRFWEDIQLREKEGKPLSLKEIENAVEEIRKLENDAYPKDIPSNIRAYVSQVNAIKDYTKDRLRGLEMLCARRLEEEQPIGDVEVKTKEEFFAKWRKSSGHLGQFLREYPEFEKLMYETTTEGANFRNQIFLQIHENILTRRREASNSNFGLYERADFATFTSLLQSGMRHTKKTETGKSVGRTWSEWYINLSSTIQHSRDIDFYASQPAGNINNLNKSLAYFQNEYVVQALSIPAVEQAFRAYETTLRTIRDANDGYIPPSLIEYDSTNFTSFWDDRAQEMLQQMIELGVVRDVKRDEFGFHTVTEDGHTVVLGDSLKETRKAGGEEVADLETAMYMTLAKGFGMASLRLLEIFANSKVPGVDHPLYGAGGGIRSIAGYEGTVIGFDMFGQLIHKFRIPDFRYGALFNMIMDEDKMPQKIDADEAIKAYEAYRNGTFEETYGEGAKRFMDLVNPSRASSALGPQGTSWRFLDTTIEWTDRQRQHLGGPARIMMGSKFSDAKVREYLIENKYREEFRRNARARGLPWSGPDFATLWKTEGREKYGNAIENEWEEAIGKRKKGKIANIDHLPHTTAGELSHKYQEAFTARVWAETAMRNPIIIAHNLTLDISQRSDPSQKKSTTLHSLIVEHVLGISQEDLQYANIAGKQHAGKYTSPTRAQREYLEEVLAIEGDIAAVREVAIRENRDLQESDFDRVIGGGRPRDDMLHKRINHAKEYWRLCRHAILGTSDVAGVENVYKAIGVTMRGDEAEYTVDWKAIEHGSVGDRLKNLGAQECTIRLSDGRMVRFTRLMDQKLIKKDWDWMFGTDDVSFREMDILGLGSRHWARRGSDVEAHANAGAKIIEYVNLLNPKPNKEDLAKKLLEIQQTYAADDIYLGWQVAGRLAHATLKLYSFDLMKVSSAAQRQVWKSRFGVDAWQANERWQFAHMLEHLSVLPPVGYSYFAGPHPIYNVHHLMKMNHATLWDRMQEILLLAGLAAMVITAFKALTTKSEEEESGH